MTDNNEQTLKPQDPHPPPNRVSSYKKSQLFNFRRAHAQREFNPRRACAAKVTVVVQCVCVRDYSRATGYEAAYERY